MEGPLSKWTNVMNGWQYRWFVLDKRTGLLSYYTSKEKMMRGSRRGCVRLKDAVVGIDDEDDSTFTITVDSKTFHFQGRNGEEREQWVSALEETILRHQQSGQKPADVGPLPSVSEFDQKLAEADAYMQLVIEQIKELEEKMESCEDTAALDKYSDVKSTAEGMVESIKHTILLMQIAKQNAFSGAGQGPDVASVMAQQSRVADETKLKLAGLANDVRRVTLSEDPPNEGGIVTEPSSQWYVETPSRVAPPSSSSGAGNRRRSVPVATAGTVLSSSGGGRPASASRASRSRGGMGNQSDTSGTSSPREPSVNSVDSLDPSLQGADDIDNGSLRLVPDASYSSSEAEDEFHDAEEAHEANGKNHTDSSHQSSAMGRTGASANSGSVRETNASDNRRTGKLDEDNALYEEDEDDLGSLESHGSIIRHLLSQVRIGMDLTKVVLPTFILERRSTLEMYADFLAHPDMFVNIARQKTPQQRMMQVVRWYMCAFHAGRKSSVAKKPYNPILGETFRCYWDVPGYDETKPAVDEAPLPWVGAHQLAFISEQVSHHPPISAFYAEHPVNRISIDGYIWTKSKFLGLSIGVHMIGKAVISLLDLDEEYTITFPSGYGRNILATPWVELGGKCELQCAKTGYHGEIVFHTKPFYGGKKHRVTAAVFAPAEKKPFCTVDGEWNGTLWAKYNTGRSEMIADTQKLVIMRKQVQRFSEQWDNESRKLWKNVTLNLKLNDVEKATQYKRELEQKQREEAKQRQVTGAKWDTKHFHEVGEHWVYDHPLQRREMRAALTDSRASSRPQGPGHTRASSEPQAPRPGGAKDTDNTAVTSRNEDGSFVTAYENAATDSLV